jgi:hypothetical protein
MVLLNQQCIKYGIFREKGNRLMSFDDIEQRP